MDCIILTAAVSLTESVRIGFSLAHSRIRWKAVHRQGYVPVGVRTPRDSHIPEAPFFENKSFLPFTKNDHIFFVMIIVRSIIVLFSVSSFYSPLLIYFFSSFSECFWTINFASISPDDFFFFGQENLWSFWRKKYVNVLFVSSKKKIPPRFSCSKIKIFFFFGGFYWTISEVEWLPFSRVFVLLFGISVNEVTKWEKICREVKKKENFIPSVTDTKQSARRVI